jgi:hypothetical protein
MGGLPEAFTILQRLQHLRLGNCITEPLACDLCQLTQLTSLEIPSDDMDDHGIHVPGPVAVRCLPSSPCNAADVHTRYQRLPRLQVLGAA